MSPRRLISSYDQLADRLQVGWEQELDTSPLQAVADGVWIGIDTTGKVSEVVVDLSDGELPPQALTTITGSFGTEAGRWISGFPRDRDRDDAHTVEHSNLAGAENVDPVLPGEPGLASVLTDDPLRVPLSDGGSLTIRRHAGVLTATARTAPTIDGQWLVVAHRWSGHLLGCCEMTHDEQGSVSGSMTFAEQIPTSALHFSVTTEPLRATGTSLDRRRTWLDQLLTSSRRDAWRAPRRAERDAITAATIARHIGDQAAEGEAVDTRRRARVVRIGRWIVLGVAIAAAGVTWVMSDDPEAPPTPRGAVFFENCTAARAAGPTPLTPADPGYRPGLDRDGDGLACE